MRKAKWFDFSFTTRDIVVMAIFVAVGSVFQVLWAHLVFQAQVLGPFTNLFASYGFNLLSFLVLYLIRKPGSATIVKLFAGILEVLLGSPVGLVAIFYSIVEGLAADIAYVLFKGNFSLTMIITGSIIAWIIDAPIDAYRDAVPLTLNGLVAYFGPGGMGKVWISLWIYLTLEALKKAGIKPLYRPTQAADVGEGDNVGAGVDPDGG